MPSQLIPRHNSVDQLPLAELHGPRDATPYLVPFGRTGQVIIHERGIADTANAAMISFCVEEARLLIETASIMNEAHFRAV